MEGNEVADVVIFSPHLDDAVLSMGAAIARMTHEGRRVQVCTAYTSGPPLEAIPRRHRAFGDYGLREAEDDRALERLGADHRRLGLHEGIWREPRPRSLVGAFRTPDVVAAFDELPRLTAVVREILSRPDVEVYAPLGVGHHVDHTEVTLAVLRAAIETDAWGRLAFYEDFYALGESIRRQHPISRRRKWPLTRATGWAAPLGGLRFWLTALIPRGPQLDDYLPTIRTMSWTSEPLAVEGFEEIKFEAIAEYRSQLPMLGGLSQIEKLYRRAHRVRGGELFWRASAAPSSTDDGRTRGAYPAPDRPG